MDVSLVVGRLGMALSCRHLSGPYSVVESNIHSSTVRKYTFEILVLFSATLYFHSTKS